MKYLTRRLVWVVLLISIGLVAGIFRTVGPSQAAIPTSAATPTAMRLVAPTNVVVFHPKGTAGAAVAGSCEMGGSLALDRSDAWRCSVGNVLYDPCFSTATHATWVICGATPEKPVGIKVTLSAPLPTRAPGKDQIPWFITLGDGTRCGAVTGATFGFGDLGANYECTERDWLIGPPSIGKVWWAVEARLSGKFGPKGPIIAHIWAVSVASVVL